MFLNKQKIYPHKDVYTNVHSSIVHNSQDMKATQMSINSIRINKAWHIHITGYHQAKQMNENIDIWYNEDKLRKHTKWKKSDTNIYCMIPFV